MKIVFPEMENSTIVEATKNTEDIEIIGTNTLEEACDKVVSGEADAMIAGIVYSSRDVILACKNILGMKHNTFSSCVVLDKNEKRYVLADIATCKNPTEDQLFDIVCQTFETAKKVLDEEPKIAMLSFSTKGSGGKDDSMTKIQNVIERLHSERPEMIVDGEMQLDAATNKIIAEKKMPDSKVGGVANVLICPDINSGNILYKAMEQFGGFTAAGPILQGFNFPASDLSRGSSASDVMKTIEIIKRLAQ